MQIFGLLLALRRRMSCGSRWRLNLGQAFRLTWKLINEKLYDRVWDIADVRENDTEWQIL
ncbi:hypothetical protein DFR51_2476 [Sphingosinicella microcystinivorans]|uniref:Uncharacterized protein n=1 Tax=Sphingosinicella microcystinivorans TaxID=335406 RepID=A0ABX9SZJ1_SPHMI|nr:hypothetical protein DFR51_2476 [Sphingosinicella microcystinivorans]